MYKAWSLEAEPETGIEMHMADGGRAFRGREREMHAGEEAANPGCVSGEDLASPTDALHVTHTTAELPPSKGPGLASNAA